MCAKCALQWGRKISALHCEFMRQAVGSGAVQSAALIASDVSHCLGLTCSEERREGLAALGGVWLLTKTGGFGAIYQRGALPQTALWYIALRSMSQNLHNTSTEPLPKIRLERSPSTIPRANPSYLRLELIRQFQ